MALLIISLLAFGKFTATLDETSALYVSFIQLHKSFGITVLLLAALRVIWRMVHTPPAAPTHGPAWQHLAARISHVLLYLLMFALPVTGWVMVSASTLNVDTVLFGVIPWPHLPVLPTLDGREAIAQLFHTLHEQSGHILIAMVLLHSAAALKHHLVDRDDVLLRMTPVWSSRAWRIKLGAAALGVIAIAAGLTAYQWSDRQAAIVAAGNAEVSFIADVTSADTPGVFADANVTALIDVSDPASSVLEATVVTASVSSDDSGVDGSIRDPDWFDIETHPEAFFASTLIEPSDDPDVLQVSGLLTIKGIDLEVQFPLTLTTGTSTETSTETSTDTDGATATEERFATGQFIVDRRAFNLGNESQPDDTWVGYDVTIKFRFPLSDESS